MKDKLMMYKVLCMHLLIQDLQQLYGLGPLISTLQIRKLRPRIVVTQIQVCLTANLFS